MSMRPDGPMRTGLQKLAASLPTNATVAEIGSWAGESALIFLERGVRHIVLVDPFDPTVCGRRPGRGASEKTVNAAKMRLQRDVLDRWPNAYWLPMTSVNAAGYLAQRERFDLVYIDGLHTELAVREDIEAWRPLVKPGGLIGGHDYTGGYLAGVRAAVDSLLGKPDLVYEDTSWVKRL